MQVLRFASDGDLKDHLGFKDGKIIRSLDVKLHKGNIINAVKFKLLLSSSRNGLNEILGVAVLKDLGFLAPDTFEVNTMVNGVSSSMIFQERLQKSSARKIIVERDLFSKVMRV